MCKCQKKANETRDAGTQTAAVTCDAETQCSAVEDGATAEFNWCVPPVDVSVQHPATGRQTAAATEKTHTASTGKATSGEKLTPWVKKKPKAGSLSGSSIINNIDGKVILQKHFLDALSVTDGRGTMSEFRPFDLYTFLIIYIPLNKTEINVFFLLFLIQVRAGMRESDRKMAAW